ncbi:hypothetical protein GCM10029992_35570 [Glycomyces albus]
MNVVRHRTATVDGRRVFYREAGPDSAPTVLLLHGFPTSSHMFRDLIPELADRYHLIAPDHLGFGQSDAPAVDDFEYSFDALASITEGLLRELQVEEFAMYVQDYGAPIGWRLALADPDRITAIITQNGNAYHAGFVEPFWMPVWAYAADPSAANETPMREGLGLDSIRRQYLHGVPDPSLVSPDTWTHDHALIRRPGNDAVQLRLFRDYVSNVALYPACSSTSATARSRCSPSGEPTTRSSDRTGRARSATTCPTPRFTSSTPDTSRSSPTSRPSPH